MIEKNIIPDVVKCIQHALCCCQRELENAGLIIRNKYKPNVFSLANEICHELGKHAVGPDWKSEEKTQRDKAKIKKQEISNAVAIWQRERILEYVQRWQ